MNDSLQIWSVFDHPPDFPGYFVARLFVIADGEVHATSQALFDVKLEGLHDKLPPGLYRLDRQAEDPPFMIESWI
jgi:hypothetical protein